MALASFSFEAELLPLKGKGKSRWGTFLGDEMESKLSWEPYLKNRRVPLIPSALHIRGFKLGPSPDYSVWGRRSKALGVRPAGLQGSLLCETSEQCCF